MDDEEQQTEKRPTTEDDNNPHQEATNRRGFVQGVLLSSLAGGAAMTLSTSGVQAQLTKQRAKSVLRLSFDRRQPPNLKQLVEIVAKTTGLYGCTECGFGGIDVLIRLDSVINPVSRSLLDEPSPEPWIGELEQPLAFEQ